MEVAREDTSSQVTHGLSDFRVCPAILTSMLTSLRDLRVALETLGEKKWLSY